MSKIIWPENTTEIIDAIRGTIGRPIEIITASADVTCSACSLDPLSHRSTNPFCPVCSGAGYITVFSGTTLSAHVRWGTVDKGLSYPGGRLITGDCQATVAYSDTTLELLQTAAYIIIDDKQLYLDTYDLRGVPEINRIVLKLLQNPRNRI